MAEHRIYYYRHLPHFQPKGATLFVTFRLYGSIPQCVLAQLETQSEQFKASLDEIIDRDERTRLWRSRRKQLFGLWDESYDHAVRDANEQERILHYILNNPVKAKLTPQWTDWPWSYSKFH